MFDRQSISSLEDYFLTADKRTSRRTFFCRINGYNEKIRDFIFRYYESAIQRGVVIDGGIPNPDDNNLSYYYEVMGAQFEMRSGFISGSLKKWLPRMNDRQLADVSGALYDVLKGMSDAGKNENMLKNAYIKFMCWLYYKFERIINQLGDDMIPKVLYDGNISRHELDLLSILSKSGCDVLMLQYSGDAAYLRLDASSQVSDSVNLPDMQNFPEDFSIKSIRLQIRQNQEDEKLYGQRSGLKRCTNAWIEGKSFQDIVTPTRLRGEDEGWFYNCFIRVNGVEDKLTYLNELYQLRLAVKNEKRSLIIFEDEIPKPENDEIAAVNRQNYTNKAQLITNLSTNIIFAGNSELQLLMKNAFTDVMLEESKTVEGNINRLTNRAVYLLCWLNRYKGELFRNWKLPETACVVYLGGCRDENEAVFLRFLSKLPVDVMVLVPDLNTPCCMSDNVLYEQNFTESMTVTKYPRENSEAGLATTAYHAERELDTLLYQDSGMYRNQQYSKAVSIKLQSTYEEIYILWDEELRFRPNFSVIGDVVNMPVIFSKISGIKDGNVSEYWKSIGKLITADTFVIKSSPFIGHTDANPIKAHAAEFYRNGRLQRAKIKENSVYKYGFLREEAQEHIFDKLQQLIDQKLIKGTFENGTEYTIVSTVLNMDMKILRMIQKFDFTKKNPKLIYVNTTEGTISLEDTILVSFLNLVGFDVVFFIPTGYQCIEQFFNKNVVEEHQNGQYVYDLTVPDFGSESPQNTHRSLKSILFGRGN